MKRLRVVLPALALLALLALASAGRGQTDSIIINNADDSASYGFTASSGLEAKIQAVAARLVFRFANSNWKYEMTPPPVALEDQLAQVAGRLVFRFANANQRYEMTPAPPALETRLGLVADRLVFRFANVNRRYAFSYPVTLIDDTVAPALSDIAVDGVGDGTRAIITWNTDEYADSMVQFGTTPGNYPETVSDGLFVREHEIVLSGLTPETTYYYRVGSADQSGNHRWSQERSFEVLEEYRLYLPNLLR